MIIFQTFQKLGLYNLYILISLIPFHFLLSELSFLFFYREIIAAFFSFLVIYYLIKTRSMSFSIRRELFYFLIFPSLLILTALYDPMISLYPSSGLADITSASLNIDPRIYILRNALLYVPLVLYLSLRGITEKDLKNIAILIVVVAPLSILNYLLVAFNEGALSLFLLAEMAESPGAKVEYNSYVPYLTFPFISAIYLLSLRGKSLLKIISFFSIAIIFIFIFLSTSRQSLLLIFISIIFFFNFDSISKSKKIIMYTIAGLIIFSIYNYLTYDIQVNQRLIDKYSSGLETRRISSWLNGLALLNWSDFFTGAGLSSVVASGPHNDYIRWTQRVGVILMSISFFPFFIGLKKAFIKAREQKGRNHHLFIFLTLFFTIYHSMFGYPREDVYQSVFCFLGLGLWLGFNKNNISKL